MAPVIVRAARHEDAPAVAAIYNAGIAGRQATFETRPREPDEIGAWFDHGLPFLVAEDGDGPRGGLRARDALLRSALLAGVGDRGVYVDPAARGRGLGRRLLDELAAESERRGFYKLTSRIFTTNAASRAVHRAAGFVEVGVKRRHGRLDGEWKDCVLVERLLGEAADDAT
jgi:L-amino acid N-acyltransferase YncA